MAGLEQLARPAAPSELGRTAFGTSLVAQHDSGENSEDEAVLLMPAEGDIGQVKEITQVEYIKDAICLLVASCTMLLANKAAVASPYIITPPHVYVPTLSTAVMQVKAFPFVSCLLILQNSATFFLIGDPTQPTPKIISCSDPSLLFSQPPPTFVRYQITWCGTGTRSSK